MPESPKLLGEEFRVAREARSLDLATIAAQIHLREVYLRAIEDEEWSVIGEPAYVRGFLRTYSRFLNLDTEAVVARFNELVTSDDPELAEARTSRPRKTTSFLRPVPIIAVLLLVLALLGIHSLGPVKHPVRPVSGAVSPQASLEPDPAAAAVASPTTSIVPSEELVVPTPTFTPGPLTKN